MTRITDARRHGGIDLGGLTAAVGGGLLVPYALTKGALTTAVRAEGWSFGGLSPAASATLLHVAETVPVLCIVVGLVCLDRRVGAGGWLAPLGRGAAMTGFGAVILTHLGEHLLPPLTVPALTGGENWFMWGYYLSWLVVYGGLALYGTGLTRTGDRPRWVPALLMAGLPATLLVGLTVTVLELFTVAGTFRIVQGLTWVVVGTWLWWGSLEERPVPGGVSADS